MQITNSRQALGLNIFFLGLTLLSLTSVGHAAQAARNLPFDRPRFLLERPAEIFLIPPPVNPLPVINSDLFKVGHKWVWDYRESDGTLYSTETYEVLVNTNGLVQIGMSTQFPNRADIRMHHRIEADIGKCLNSYRNPARREPWSIRLYFWDKDHWYDTGVPHTLAFEEKFNCNPHSAPSIEQRAAIYKPGDSGELFLIPRKTGREASWFHSTGPDAAVQAEKEFVEKGKLLFQSKLRTEPRPAS